MIKFQGKFYKKWALVLARAITKFSMPFLSFPEACKITKVQPLFKKGSKTDQSNYRPISLLSYSSDVFESVVLHQTEELIRSYIHICLSILFQKE